MQIACTQTVTRFVSDALRTQVATMSQLTLIKCEMSTYRAQLDGCRSDESQKKPVNCSKPTRTENSYASIITTALDHFSAQR